MSESSPQSRFEDICRQFEKALASGESPDIEKQLDCLSAEALPSEALLAQSRSALFLKLLCLELQHRLAAGESCFPDDYQSQSGEFGKEIEVAFSEVAGDSAGEPMSTAKIAVSDDEAMTIVPNRSVGDEGETVPPRKSEETEPVTILPAGQGTDGDTIAQRLKRFGDYEILDEIARGGMGVVYKARQVSLNRVVALKMILAGQLAGEEEVQRFQAEAEAAANLNHPGIVPIHEIGQVQDQHFFSMGFVAGESLADKVSDGPLTAQVAATYLQKIAEAIAFAHERKVIHRDLKPANVLIDSDDQPKVTDFGLAKQVESDSDLTRTGAVMGTPSYMPPEQAAGKADLMGPQSDVYSLGAILYCLMTGRPPFQAATSIDTLMQVLEKEPVTPRSLDPGIPKDLETICLKCLQKDVSRRYQSAAELSEELGRFLNGEPVRARPVGRLERSWRWAKRKPALAILGAAVAVLFVALLGGALLVAVQQSRIADQAQANADQQTRFAIEQANLRKKADEQRELAKENQLLAEEEAGRAKQMLELMTQSFGKVNPNFGARSDLTARDVLIDVRSRVDELSRAEDKAELLGTLAGALKGLGETDAAISCRREALQLLVDELGHNSIKTAWAKNRLGLALRSNPAARAEVLRLYRESVATAENLPNVKESRLFVMMVNDLAWAVRSRGNMQEAIKLHKRTVEQGRKTSPHSRYTIRAIADLATALDEVGRIEESRQYMKQAFDLATEHFDPEHFVRLDVVDELAEFLMNDGEVERALALTEANFETVKRVYAPTHFLNLRLANRLHRALVASGRLSDAIELQVSQMKLIRDVRGNEDLNFVAKFGSVYRSAVTQATTKLNQHYLKGEFDKARRYVVPLVELQTNFNYQTNPKIGFVGRLELTGVGFSSNSLLEKCHVVQLALNNDAAAKATIQRWIEALEASKPTSQRSLAQAKTSLADAQLALGDLDEALESVKSALAIEKISERERLRAEQIQTVIQAKRSEKSVAELVQATDNLLSLKEQIPAHLAWYTERAESRLQQIRDLRKTDSAPSDQNSSEQN